MAYKMELKTPRGINKRSFDDDEKLRADLERCFGEESDSDRKATFKFSYEKRTGRLKVRIATSYSKAEEVIPEVFSIAIRNGMDVYDRMTDIEHYADLMFRKGSALMIRRGKNINQLIINTMHPYKLFKIGEDLLHGEIAYVVSIYKQKRKTIEEQTIEFDEVLRSVLKDGEELVHRNRSFIINGRGYRVTYCLEAYKKRCDRIAFIDEEKEIAKTELIRRMGCVEARKWISDLRTIEAEDIFERMSISPMKRNYRNPADRFVESVNIEKRFKKAGGGFRISRNGFIDREFCFERNDDDWGKSRLKIEDDTAFFILPVICKHYPYLHERLSGDNYIPFELWRRIEDDIVKLKKSILHDTFNEDLNRFYDDFCLNVLAKDEEDIEMIKSDPLGFIFRKRRQIAEIYDIFLEWIGEQLDDYYCGGVIKITSP